MQMITKMRNFIQLFFICIGFMAFSQNGKVGIGVSPDLPTASLHVKSTDEYVIRQEDNVNTASSNFIITSADANGKFQKTPTSIFRKVQIISLPTSGTSTVTTASPGWQVTNVQVTLPPGRWALTGTIALKPNVDLSSYFDIALTCNATLSDVSATISSDVESNYTTSGNGFWVGNYNSPSEYSVMTGTILVNNATSADKTYTIIANISRTNVSPYPTAVQNVGFSKFGIMGNATDNAYYENQIYAIPVFKN